ncbi:MAG: MATE family efflux transporter [Bacillota bacterium]
MGKEFLRYVSFNILGMVGISFYILADTYFIAAIVGPMGLAALNFAIPVYCAFNAVGLMFGMGGGANYSIAKARGDLEESREILKQTLCMAWIFSIVFTVFGIIFTPEISILLGADAETLDLTITYIKTMIAFTIFFVTNTVCLAFVRNFGQPKIVMCAMLTGSMMNILLDYIFMYHMNMGIFGASFATGLSPIISLCVLYFLQFRKMKYRLPWKFKGFYGKAIITLGASTWVAEVSNALVMVLFNLLILDLEGNIGLAAYGVVANIALVMISVFNGVAQGVQPLASREFGKNDREQLKNLVRLGGTTSFLIGLFIYIFLFFTKASIIAIFNETHNQQLAELAMVGFDIYFLGILFSGINVVIAAYFSATEQAKSAMMISVCRGIVLLVPSAIILSKIFLMNGIWSSAPVTEGLTFLLVLYLLKREYKIQ